MRDSTNKVNKASRVKRVEASRTARELKQSKQNAANSPFFTIIFLTVSLLMLLLAGFLVYGNVQFQKKATVVTGYVAEVVYHKSGLDDTTPYSTIIGFRATDGKPHFFRPGVSSNRPLYAQHDPVTVRYDPQHPDEARLDSFMENWFGAGVVGVIGLGFMLGAVMCWRFR